jgi:hypothetical protein
VIVPTEWWSPGRRFEDILHKIVAHKYFIEEYGDQPQAWIKRHLDLFREHSEPMEYRRMDGTWCRVHYKRLQDGGTIGRFLDITASRQREETLRRAQKWRPWAS